MSAKPPLPNLVPPLPPTTQRTEDAAKETFQLFDYIFLQLGDQNEARRICFDLLAKNPAQSADDEHWIRIYREAKMQVDGLPLPDLSRMQNPSLVASLDNPHSSARKKKKARAYLRLCQSIFSLSPKEREVISLYCRSRFNTGQVAEILSYSQDQVGGIYAEAVQKIRTQIPSLPDDLRRNISEIPTFAMDTRGGRNPRGTDLLRLHAIMKAQRPLWPSIRWYLLGFFLLICALGIIHQIAK